MQDLVLKPKKSRLDVARLAHTLPKAHRPSRRAVHLQHDSRHRVAPEVDDPADELRVRCRGEGRWEGERGGPGDEGPAGGNDQGSPWSDAF